MCSNPPRFPDLPMIRAMLTLGLATALLTSCGAATGESAPLAESAGPDDPATPAKVGLHTSLPIVWRESGDIADLLQSESAPHWVLSALRRRGEVVPFDTLAGERGLPALPSNSLLVLAQPRALSPDDNVALDEWVRGGGRVLLFADPMLTRHSAFAIGDPRRPQDMALLSPILGRWGLELMFDESQQGGPQSVDWRGHAVPTNLRGSWQATGSGCTLEGDALVARCKVGKGWVLAFADAALLENAARPADSLAEKAFESLLDEASVQ